MSSTTETAKANLRPASWSTKARNKVALSNTSHLGISQDSNGLYRAHVMTADSTQTKRLRTIPEALAWKDREEHIHHPEDFELRIVLPSLSSSSSSSPSGSVRSLIRLVFCSHESVSLSQCERPPAICFDCVSQRWPHFEPPAHFVSIKHTVKAETDAWVETVADDDDGQNWPRRQSTGAVERGSAADRRVRLDSPVPHGHRSAGWGVRRDKVRGNAARTRTRTCTRTQTWQAHTRTQTRTRGHTADAEAFATGCVGSGRPRGSTSDRVRR